MYNRIFFALLFCCQTLAADDYSKVQSILADKCYACHGPDSNQREADLRLDLEADATRKLPSGNFAINRDRLGDGELLNRILATDPEERMPPADSEKQLTRAEKNLIEAWIAKGAKFKKHWSFVAPVKSAAIKMANQTANPIDHFIDLKLAAETRSRSNRANRVTLARRASLDLRGIPPSIQEVDKFVNDKANGAWSRYLDRMFASKHYGERMAQDWLDLARYGDTNGYHADSDRTIWLYRDYVIDAFNSNKPFDEFIVENMAGDLMPNATDETRIASGFNRCNTFNEEGGADPEEFYVAYAVDRANTAGQVFLGLTVGCAQCHDHKYDPISQKDYYRLVAFFNSVDGEVGAGGPGGYHNKELPPLLSVPTKEQNQKLTELKKQIQAKRKEIDAFANRYRKPSAELLAALDTWALKLQSDQAPSMPHLGGMEVWFDASDINGNGVNDQKEKFSPPEKIKVWKDKSGNGHHAESLSAPTYKPNGLAKQPVVAFDGIGNHMRTQTGGDKLNHQFTIFAVFKSTAEKNHQMLVMWGEESVGKRRSIWRHVDGRFSFNGYGRDVVGNQPTGTLPHVGVITRAENGEVDLNLDGKVGGKGNPGLNQYANKRITLGCNNGNGEFAAVEFSEIIILNRKITDGEKHQLGKYLGAKYALKTEFGGAPKSILDIVKTSKKDRKSEDQVKLQEYFAKNVFASTKKESDRLNKELAELVSGEKSTRNAISTTLVMKEKKQRNPAFVLMRGDFQQRGEKVEPGVPSILPPMKSNSARNRLGLAKWLTDKQNPLVARVFVNRFWKQLFGTGLVKTLGDFGTQGELPTHPELLDWLAIEFVDSGWNVKSLQKKMLMSETYQQSSVMSQKDEQDPYNRWLSRASRFRLSAEEIRDSALSISGLLNTRVGGPSVKPYQPAGFYSDKVGRNWSQSKGNDLYRRGLYTYWRRTTLYPTFQIFDAPSREFCTVNRSRTNTPLQALVLMNDPAFVEAARVFGERIMTKSKKRDDRLVFAFRSVVCRHPTKEELALLESLLDSNHKYFEANKAKAGELISNGEAPRISSLDTSELAAWTIVASVLLNLDETVTRE